MGDVTVADGVAIAPGVVLQAAPGSRIVINAGACLAGGVCIQSRKGVLTIGVGVNLGANVLIVGNGTIGKHACISPGSTLMNPKIETEGLIPPGSLVIAKSTNATSSSTHNNGSTNTKAGFSSNGMTTGGFTSGSYVTNTGSAPNFTSGFSAGFVAGNPPASPSPTQVTVPPQNDSFVNTFVEPPPVGPKPIEVPSLSGQNGQYVDPSEPASPQSNGVQLSNGHSNNSSALSTSGNHRVYGKEQVSQLLSTLFPHR